MADAKLTFLRPHDGTGRLVFGDVGDVVVTPPVTIAVDTDLPGGLGLLVVVGGLAYGGSAGVAVPHQDAGAQAGQVCVHP